MSEVDLTKLAAGEQDAYGRIAARGFMDKMGDLSMGEMDKESGARSRKIMKALTKSRSWGRKAKAAPKLTKKQLVQKFLKLKGRGGKITAAAVGGAAVGGGAYAAGRSTGRKRTSKAYNSLMRKLYLQGRLR